MRGTSLQEENLNSCLQGNIVTNSLQSQNPSIALLRSWLNKTLKIGMSDGRILIGTFLCTDREGNIIIGSCQEFLKNEDGTSIDEPRILGLVMVPGRHIVQMHLDLLKT